LLESQNEELQKIKLELTKLKNITPSSWEKIWLERFKECSKKLLKHLDKYAIQSENPEIIQLVFDIVFWWKMQYDELMLQTPLNKQLLALENKKDFQEIWKSNQNHNWWTTNQELQTIYNQIVNMIDKFGEWQWLINETNAV
jgi:hypothetical protein